MQQPLGARQSILSLFHMLFLLWDDFGSAVEVVQSVTKHLGRTFGHFPQTIYVDTLKLVVQVADDNLDPITFSHFMEKCI